MFFLIEDYLTMGLYHDKTNEVSRIKKGKIDWKKTIQSKQMVSDEDIFFPSIYYKGLSIHDSLLTRLEVFCLNESKS
jgi:hypothetical protein